MIFLFFCNDVCHYRDYANHNSAFSSINLKIVFQGFVCFVFGKPYFFQFQAESAKF